jgi:hypothetical protein
MNPPTLVFTATEIFQQLHRELFQLGLKCDETSLVEWNQYILARTVEDILLVDLSPGFDRCKENIANVVRSNYRRSDGEETFTLHQDVGTNKLFPIVSSGDIPFESQLQLHRNCVLIGPRKQTP